MNQTQQKEYSRKAAQYQQLALPITQNIEIAEDEPVFVANAQLEELDYRKLYKAYSAQREKIGSRTTDHVQAIGVRIHVRNLLHTEAGAGLP